MLPAVAAPAVTHHSRPGELVLDPMCGIGTTLVEAVHHGRKAIGVEYETRWGDGPRRLAPVARIAQGRHIVVGSFTNDRATVQSAGSAAVQATSGCR
jgi:23S rRNA G2445 N2-methylase RlmL